MARLGTEQDADVLLRDFGVDVVWYEVADDSTETTRAEGKGIYDEPGELFVADAILTVDRSVTVETAVFDGIASEDLIRVDGEEYTVADVLPQSDGVYARIGLT